MKCEVPIWEKANLTLEEAAAYSGIGINRIRDISDEKNCPFVLWVGTKRLIKRKAFERYLEQAYSIRKRFKSLNSTGNQRLDMIDYNYHIRRFSNFEEVYKFMPEKRKDSRGRVLKDGESQRSDGNYQYRYTDIRGKRKYVYANTLEDLRDKEKVIEKAFNDGLDYQAGEITLLELVKKYLAQKQGMRYNTKLNYDFVQNILQNEDFCFRKINTIKPSDAKEWFIKLHNDGRRYSTIQSIRGVVKPAFDMAIEEDVLRKNPFAFTLTKVIPDDTVERRPLTAEEEEKLLAFIQEDKCRRRYYDVVVILLGTGLRISELCGLTISDVDFKKRRLRVERQLVRTKHCEYYTEKPKTASGIRYIPLTDEKVCQAFKRVIRDRKKPKIEMIIDGVTGFLFLDQQDKPKVAGHFEHALKRIVDKYNETYHENLVATPHVFRHTFCTRMAQAGMPVKEFQYLMGHADVGTTLRIYAHLSYDAAEKSYIEIVAKAQ